MITRLAFLTLTLIGAAGLAQAQTTSTVPEPMPAKTAPAAKSTEAAPMHAKIEHMSKPSEVATPATATTAKPIPIHEKTVQTAKAAEKPAAVEKSAKSHVKQAMARTCSDPKAAAITDEYGFRYDSRGDRLNAAGCVIAPPHTLLGAKVIQD